jgi:membrane protease YdiL (CAAX protease family)
MYKSLNEKFTLLISSLSERPLSIVITIVLVLDLLVTILFSLFLFPDHNSGPKFESKYEALFIVVIVSPILETYIFQTVIIGKYIRKYPNSVLHACIISAIFFGLMHYYSIPYILKTFASGFFYGVLFLVSLKKIKHPYIPVIIAHSAFNLIGFCIDFFS